MEYLTTQDIAEDLGLQQRSVQRYCQEGVLPFKVELLGKNFQYLIKAEDYIKWKHENFKASKSESRITRYKSSKRPLTKNQLRDMLAEWIHWSETGLLTGKPISTRTIEIYSHYIEYFFTELGRKPKMPIISLENLRLVLGQYRPEQFSTKQKIYDSVMSFSKYLVEKDLLTSETRDSLRKVRPKRSLPPKRTVASEEQIKELLKVIDATPLMSPFNRLLDKTLVIFIAKTGLRAMEVCNLKLEHVDLNKRTIFVYLGKGAKNRKVGISDDLFELLTAYINERLKMPTGKDSFFISSTGSPLKKKTLMQKMKRLSLRSGIEITCHGLRRSFASINSSKGRPLNHLRIALGHSDLSTTQSYIMTTENEVIEAMKIWQ